MASTVPHRIGILGGTFDPIHLGHLAIAEDARERLHLDRVIVIPTGQPWLKSGQQVTPADHRLAMVTLAIQDSPGLEVSSIEIDRPGPTYTVDTLVELREDLGDEAEFYFILGMDSLRELRRWYQPERLFELCTVVAVSRPDSRDVSPTEIEREFPAARDRIKVFRGPMLNVSATDIRQRLADGRSISASVPPPVEQYISEHGLYLSDRTATVTHDTDDNTEDADRVPG